MKSLQEVEKLLAGGAAGEIQEKGAAHGQVVTEELVGSRGNLGSLHTAA